jgi:peptidoglycan/xylan/chitin deacetylase (PgdA/CDA1 family)
MRDRRLKTHFLDRGAVMRLALGAAAMLLVDPSSANAGRPEIAITIDDLPVHSPYPPGVTALEVNREMIGALRHANVPVTAFVNAKDVTDEGTNEALLDWRSAGFVLGNHTWSHAHLEELTIPEFEDELEKDEPILQRLGGGSDWRWFRYPFLDEGKDRAQRIAARQVLKAHGYKIAAVTMSFSDWAFTPAYARCMAKADKASLQGLRHLYLKSVRENLASSRNEAKTLYGRDIPYVLLMHVSAMSAKMMPQVIAIYRSAGFRFVSLTDAERDPAYAGYTDLGAPPPPSPDELALEKHVELADAPDYSAMLEKMCI